MNDYVDKDKKPQFRVWYASDGGDLTFINVVDVEEAKKKIKELTERDLKLEIIWNAMGLEVFEDGAWTEWYNEFGQGIDEIMSEEEINETDNNGSL